ncbi:MAG: hypothetical protein IT581_01325 [Verrucomicrobiales bacterium]|nr:hypothetical protein [Verrucomicrobiales bacterium]
MTYPKLAGSIVGITTLATLVPAAAFGQGRGIGTPNDEGDSGPFVTIQVDGVSYDGPKVTRGKDEAGKDIWEIEDFTLRRDGFFVTISGQLNPDPSIAYGLAVTDFGAPSDFLFVFGVPIVPTGSPNTVDASVVGGITDLTGNGASVTPTLGASLQVAEVGIPLTSMGVDVGAAAAFAPGPPGSFHVYGPYASGPIPGPGPGPWTFLQASTGFGLSGGGDVLALTGFAQIVEIPVVPEVGTMTAGAILSLGGATWVMRRRSRA